MEEAPLLARLPPPGEASADTLLDGFLHYVAARGHTLYAAQEEAILEILSGSNVILATPTGSGKSLVAEAMHYRALALCQVSYYTAPIKALVSEKFFELCRVFGPDAVGMLTGDGVVNRDAPITCCTAEILANLALREGERAGVQHIVMDEFHYYSDRDRGVAWQIPLLTMPQSTYLLMSATLGDTALFVRGLEELTGRSTVLVQSDERPVPLDFEYRETPLHETIDDLLTSERAPVYIVHFSQRAATQQAQSLMSLDFLSRARKQAIKDELRGFRFDTPFGRELKRFVHHGVGVHHAGLLPKYRLMVEKLAQQGHLKLICGTDTLGMGVNIPIRSVLFTRLCKYDGQCTRVLSVRDFKQISGRAGRKGFDERGAVVAQAPEHVIENLSKERKAKGDAKKMRKLVRHKPPTRGYAHWDRATFERLASGDPEPLDSSFTVSHAMLLHLLERPGDGCRAIASLIRGCHEGRKSKRRHARRAIAMFRSLLGAGIVQVERAADGRGHRVRLNEHLQVDFSLNQALGLWTVETLEALDLDAPDHALDVVTLVEAVLENPTAVLLRQVDKLKGELVAELKGQGVQYEERMAELEKVEWPKPRRELVYDTFNAFAARHPWVGENIRPKSVARDMWERAATFNEYVKEYGLARCEGVLLRYLSDVYKALLQTVPEDDKTEALYDFSDWLGAVVRQVDSSLLDAWEKMREPGDEVAGPTAQPQVPPVQDVTANQKDFTVLVRNALFRLVRYLARREYAELVDALDRGPAQEGWTDERVATAMAPYWEEHGELRTDPSARAPSWFRVTRTEEAWLASQTLLDPEEHGEWHLDVRVDLRRSREEQRPVLELTHLGPEA